ARGAFREQRARRASGSGSPFVFADERVAAPPCRASTPLTRGRNGLRALPDPTRLARSALRRPSPSARSTTVRAPDCGRRASPRRVIRLDSVDKRHGRQALLMDASCAVFRGEKVGLIGPNGSGKSTIFRMIVGE